MEDYFYQNNYNVLASSKENYPVEMIPRNLMYTKRYTAFDFPANFRRQTVAEHVFGCLGILDTLKDVLKKSNIENAYADAAHILMHHDDAEAIMGDIPAPLKDDSGQYQKEEEYTLSQLKTLKTEKVEDTVLQLTHCIDMLECLYYSVECAMSGFVMVVEYNRLEPEYLHEIALRIVKERIEKLASMNTSIAEALNTKHVIILAQSIFTLNFNEKTRYSKDNRRTQAPKSFKEYTQKTRQQQNNN